MYSGLRDGVSWETLVAAQPEAEAWRFLDYLETAPGAQLADMDRQAAARYRAS